MPRTFICQPAAAAVVSRIGAALVGGWAFVWGFATLGIALLLTAGMPYSDARTLVYQLAFIVFLVAFCWAFAARSGLRAWTGLAGGGALMTALGWWLARIDA